VQGPTWIRLDWYVTLVRWASVSRCVGRRKTSLQLYTVFTWSSHCFSGRFRLNTFLSAYCHHIAKYTQNTLLLLSDLYSSVLVAFYQKKWKNGLKGVFPRSGDLILNFGRPWYLWKGWSYKIQILQVDWRLRGTKQIKMGQSGRCLGRVMYRCSLKPIIIRWQTQLLIVNLVC